MSNWLDHFVEWLAAQGAGSHGTSLFRARHPLKQPASLLTVVVSPTGGVPLNVGTGIDFPAVQVMHRHEAFDVAWSAAWSLYSLLRKAGPIRLGSGPAYTMATAIRALASPAQLGKDEVGAWLVVTNYEIEIMAE